MHLLKQFTATYEKIPMKKSKAFIGAPNFLKILACSARIDDPDPLRDGIGNASA